LPTVSIVIPARNEEAQIGVLLDSLLQVDYPPELLQIVVANDQSTDRTREIAQSYAERFECRFDIREVQDEPEVNLRLKTRALCQGLDRATGEIILMTDADCIIPPDWARTMASYFTPGVGMVCGTTIPQESAGSHGLLTQFETLDWLFLLGASSGLAGLGSPKGVIGNNFSIRRSTYEELGTFRALERTDPYDDLALMNAVSGTGSRVVFPADKGLLIFTKPTESLYEIARQRRRWLIGIKETGWLGKTVIGLGFVAHISAIFWFLLVGWWAAIPVLLLVLGDACVLTPMMFRYEKARLAWLLPFYPFFAAVYVLLAVFVILRGGEFVWKGRGLSVHPAPRRISLPSWLASQTLSRRLRTSTEQ
jgi:cellulose synthase/poly-beta-1,6-N-acetylglucosamine synthase-like glycosyltransferase